MKIIYKDDKKLTLEEKQLGIQIVAGISLGIVLGVAKHLYFQDPHLFFESDTHVGFIAIVFFILCLTYYQWLFTTIVFNKTTNSVTVTINKRFIKESNNFNLNECESIHLRTYYNQSAIAWNALALKLHNGNFVILNPLSEFSTGTMGKEKIKNQLLEICHEIATFCNIDVVNEIDKKVKEII